jgi:hypothetical protein
MNDGNFPPRQRVTNRQLIVGPLEGRVVPEWVTMLPERRMKIVRRDVCQTSPANTISLAVHKRRNDMYHFFDVI